MDEPLAEEFDVIVIGTGLAESVLSGALSRIGKSVLHIDQNKFYGSNWASFSIKDFDDFVAASGLSEIDRKVVDSNSLLEGNESFVPVSGQRPTINGGSSKCYLEKVDKTPQSDDSSMPTTESNLLSGETSKEEVNKQQDIGDISTESKDVPVATEEESKVCQDQLSTETVSEEVETNVGKTDNNDKNVEDGPSDKLSEGDPKVERKQPKYPTYDDFYNQWRRFNIDLAPKLMFSRGKLVELLIQSNVARYLEFRNVSRTLTVLPGQNHLQPVPCSRADVFNSKFVTVIEKRILMRVLTLCANYEAHPEEYEEYKDRPFSDFLHSKRLSQKAQHFVIHSIAMVSESSTTLEGLQATRKFLQSLGRYGNSAFLWPMYGVGELPQAFSRLSAVFGGTFCLRRNAVGLILNKESGKCTAIIDSQGQKIKCKHLILDESNIPDMYRCEFSDSVSRAVYVTNKSVLSADKENVSLVTIPPEGSRPSVRVIEAGPQCCVCPSKYYLVHALTSSTLTGNDLSRDPTDKFREVEKILFAGPASNGDASQDGDKELDDKPQILWASYFDIMENGVNREMLPSNVHVMRGPGMDLGFDATMENARVLFEKICPEGEFLPRAPDPEEIVFDDEGYNTETNGGGAVGAGNQEEEGGDYVDEGEELREGDVENEEALEAVEEPPAQDEANAHEEINES